MFFFFKILKRFVRPEDGVRLSEDTRYSLQQKISNKEVKGPEVFDEALNEVEFILREDLYPLFLNSDVFLQVKAKCLLSLSLLFYVRVSKKFRCQMSISPYAPRHMNLIYYEEIFSNEVNYFLLFQSTEMQKKKHRKYFKAELVICIY